MSIIKIILVGDSDVGKSCFMEMFVDGTFSSYSNLTIGVDYACKKIKIKEDTVNLRIWDTAGQEMYRSLVDLYFRNTNGALVFFSLLDKRSFINAIHIWIPKLLTNNIPFILVGTKCEDIHHIVISKEEIIEYCDLHDISYLETSSKDNINIHNAFQQIVEKVYRPESSDHQIQIVSKKSRCCS